MKTIFGNWPNAETAAAAVVAARSSDTYDLLEWISTTDLTYQEGVTKVADGIRRGFEASLTSAPAERVEEAKLKMATVDWHAVAMHLVNEHRMRSAISRSLSELQDRIPRSRRFDDQIVLDVCKVGDDSIEVTAERDGKPCCPLCGDLAPDDFDSRPMSTGLLRVGDAEQDKDASEESAMRILMCSECQGSLIPPGLITKGTH